jgi:predicted enzyme related to lactoylglutathione lyase
VSEALQAGARLGNLNLFGADIACLCDFYGSLFGFPEIAARRTAIYRVLDAGGVELGFNADAAYDLLGLSDRRAQGKAPATAYPTFDVSAAGEVDALALRAVQLGGTVVKPAYRTHYGAWQVVLADPEAHVFRIHCRNAPAA